MLIGNKIIHLSSVDSTSNYIANEEIRQNLPSGAVILADEQTAGKGQRGAEWLTKPGENLTFSFLLREVNLTVENQFTLNKIIALSILDLLHDKGIDAKIKWPNDILIGNNKVSGILIENSLGSSGIQKSIIGVGLNVNQTDFNIPRTTSMQLESDSFFNIREILFGLIGKINSRLSQIEQRDTIHSEYLSHLFGLNEQRDFIIDEKLITGRIIGVNSFGLLELEINEEIQSFGIKEIKFLYQ